jgi:hypothetical protein
MKLSQAIVSSGIASANQNNKLIAWSSDISEEIAHELCLWCPRPEQFARGASTSLNIFPVSATDTAIARSVLVSLGNKKSVRTRVAIVNRFQLKGYQSNFMTLARVLESNGDLTLVENDSNQLPELHLPDCTIPDVRQSLPNFQSSYPQKLEHAIDIHKHCVVLGLKDPRSFICGFLATVPQRKRTCFSMTTGTTVSENMSQDPDQKRNYNLHFLQESTRVMDAEFARLQLRTITIL